MGPTNKTRTILDGSEANAHLMAAAPDLLAALEELMEWQNENACRTLANLRAADDDRCHPFDAGGHVVAIYRARAAIAKAKGEA